MTERRLGLDALDGSVFSVFPVSYTLYGCDETQTPDVQETGKAGGEACPGSEVGGAHVAQDACGMGVLVDERVRVLDLFLEHPVWAQRKGQ